MPPRDYSGAAALTQVLSTASRRLLTAEMLAAVTVAIPVGTIVYLALRWAGLPTPAAAALGPMTVAGAGATLLIRRADRWSAASGARAIERAYPVSRNVVVTAEELRDIQSDAAPHASLRHRLAIARDVRPAAVPMGRQGCSPSRP